MWTITLFIPSQVSVTAREDVPPFGPVLPDPPIFTEVGNEAIIYIIYIITLLLFWFLITFINFFFLLFFTLMCFSNPC